MYKRDVQALKTHSLTVYKLFLVCLFYNISLFFFPIVFYIYIETMTRNDDAKVPNGSILQVDSPEPTLLEVETLDPG